VPDGDVTDVRIRAAGDAGFVLEMPARMDEATSARAVALARGVRFALRGRARDIVVGYHTVTVYFDPTRFEPAEVRHVLTTVAADAAAAEPVRGAHLDIPVCYGGDLGPDLPDLAAAVGCTTDEVIDLHTGREYRVFVVGFVPGFAYMGPLAPKLASIGRRPKPRTRVPPGSVAIAGGQTGIYPVETPGGWHILGRTPIRPFDPGRTPPVLFAPGDHVRFRAIDRGEFDRMVS
jgi:inhibitor of KinA